MQHITPIAHFATPLPSTPPLLALTSRNNNTTHWRGRKARRLPSNDEGVVNQGQERLFNCMGVWLRGDEPERRDNEQSMRRAIQTRQDTPVQQHQGQPTHNGYPPAKAVTSACRDAAASSSSRPFSTSSSTLAFSWPMDSINSAAQEAGAFSSTWNHVEQAGKQATVSAGRRTNLCTDALPVLGVH